MTTPLEQLLEQIDPVRTVEQTQRRADAALNSFSFPTEPIITWNDFVSCIMGFVAHVESHILQLADYPQVERNFHANRSLQWLDHLYGPSGDKAAFERIRTGKEGGLYGVLKALALKIAEQVGSNEIANRISHFWHSLTPDQQYDATSEYLDKFGHLLPDELTEGSAARVRANFTKVLTEHPRLLQQLGRIGR